MLRNPACKGAAGFSTTQTTLSASMQARPSSLAPKPFSISVAGAMPNGGERFADTWPFTGKKTELLEGGLRIPMVIA
jgi:hypothetical protein